MHNTIQKIKVYNMTSPRGGEVPNQFEIVTPEGTYFQSYSSIIAFRPTYKACINPNAGVDNEPCPCPRHDGKIVLDLHKWDYSTTTGKYRNQFLGEGIAETRKGIAEGRYVLADLNS